MNHINLYSIDCDDSKSENIKSNNPFDYKIIFEDIKRENEYTKNPLNINNSVEHNNISSMNIIDENKIFDYISNLLFFQIVILV